MEWILRSVDMVALCRDAEVFNEDNVFDSRKASCKRWSSGKCRRIFCKWVRVAKLA